MWVKQRVGAFDIANYVIITVMCVVFLYPLVITLSLSFSDAGQLAQHTISLMPYGLSTDAYRLLLSDGRIVRYYLNTILYASTGTLVMLVCTSMMAYPLMFKEFRGRTLVTVLLTITLFFGGGLVPYYLVMLKLGLMDTIWALILPGAISAWNVFIFRTFFSDIPASLRESAQIDGAGHFTVLGRIIVPLSKPLLATFTLFSVVGFWNDFFNALLFLRSQEKQPVQLFLRRILVLMEYKDVQTQVLLQSIRNVSSRTVKGAAVMLTITPILCVYPFLQKYFAKGIMVGAIKS